MALIFIDGFDHYDDGEMLKKWDSKSSMSPSIATSSGRFSGGSLYTDYYSEYMEKYVPVQSTYYVGVAIRPTGIPYSNTDNALVQFYASNNNRHLRCGFNASGYAIVEDNAKSRLATSSNIEWIQNNWFYFEVMGTIHDTTGAVIIRVNGVEVINETGLDTKNDSGDNDIGKIRIYPNTSSDTRLDDFYIDDAQFHGDVRVKTFLPDSDSPTHTDFVRSTGSNDYECVDESVPNDDTDYISANVVGDKSTFGITTGALGTIAGIQLNNYLRKDDAGTRKIKPIIRSNSVDYQGAELSDVPADYAYHNDTWELDPDDSGAWTQAKLEAAEFGLEITT